jgi:hypothetical protein
MGNTVTFFVTPIPVTLNTIPILDQTHGFSKNLWSLYFTAGIETRSVTTVTGRYHSIYLQCMALLRQEDVKKIQKRNKKNKQQELQDNLLIMNDLNFVNGVLLLLTIGANGLYNIRHVDQTLA